MDLRQFDLNLLLVLDALLKDRHVTLAARRLGMSQPAVSAALNKLRLLFDDRLFVKRSKGMDPTPRALELERPLVQVLETIHEELLGKTAFDPRTTERTFVLVMGEIGQMVFVGHILARFRSLAPGANVRVVAPAVAEREGLLEDGRADLAIGHFPQWLQPNLFQQRLYSRPLVCVARKKHAALARGPLTLESFAALDHAVVGTESNFQHLYEPELRRLGVRRRVVVELPNMSTAPLVLAQSDLLAILPELLAEIYCRDGALRIVELPFALPAYEVKQFWHRKLDQDPAVTWLRQLLAADFQPRDTQA
jgi:DNA-binding transcriptional LysR family regulator